MRKYGLKYGLGLIAVLSLIACSHKEVFFEFHSIKNAIWDRSEKAVFEVNIKDNAKPFAISLEVRSNNDYPFRNIWLFVDFKTPGSTIRTDTVSADLADIYGKWYGKGISLYSLSIPYEPHFLFPDTGTYSYTIRQGMRENPLIGISDIGLKVSEKTGK
ncbi:MAG: gliding motility lipoprotein GldH [Candidatus Symbiothrix sp.]|jgi:gliding motility-associated lipoprotein GldH|nr:gliding motility lipoprotein GldH [Candidatus Symbiothrix sp.]